MDIDIKKKAIKGISWNLSENFLSYFISFVIGVTLARILSPKDYGLLSMTVVFYSIAEVLIDSGFGSAYVQKRDADEKDANTVFVINFVLSLGIYAILWFTAPIISKLFNEPLLIKLIRVMSIILIINSFNIIQLAIIRKKLEFKKKSLITILSSIISGVIGIICAIRGMNVWSLAIQQISNKIIMLIGLAICTKYKFKLYFSIKSFNKMFKFGIWLVLSGITIRILNNLYRIIIGKFYSADQLGYYDRGSALPSMIYERISWSVGIVCLPVYAKLENENNELNNALYNFVNYSCLITLPLLTILFVIAKPLVLLLLTEKWLNIVVIIKIYCIIGAITPLFDYLIYYVTAIGKSKLDLKYNLFVNILRLINVAININNGIKAIVIGEVIVKIIALISVSIDSKKYTGINYLKILTRLKWQIICVSTSIIIGIIVYKICPETLIVKILVPSIVMIIVYIAILYIKEKKIITDLIVNIKGCIAQNG